LLAVVEKVDADHIQRPPARLESEWTRGRRGKRTPRFLHAALHAPARCARCQPVFSSVPPPGPAIPVIPRPNVLPTRRRIPSAERDGDFRADRAPWLGSVPRALRPNVVLEFIAVDKPLPPRKYDELPAMLGQPLRQQATRTAFPLRKSWNYAASIVSAMTSSSGETILAEDAVRQRDFKNSSRFRRAFFLGVFRRPSVQNAQMDLRLAGCREKWLCSPRKKRL